MMAGTGGRNIEAAHFAMVPRNDIPRSAFDITHTHKTTFDSGYLIPVYVDEVLPGDSIRLQMTAFARLAVPITPVMDNLILETFFFFVPNRLTWQNWERFMGEREDPAETTQYLLPYVDLGISAGWTAIGTLSDYFGITSNVAVTGSVRVNSLPFRAYQLIWNDWFRDEDLQPKLVVPTMDGPDVASGMAVLLRRNKRHDYFTSCRPWPQKPINAALFQDITPLAYGQSMTFPQAGAPVSGIGVIATQTDLAGPLSMEESGSRLVTYDFYHTGTNLRARSDGSAADTPDIRVLINDIRTANVVQTLLERSARGGSRYAELVRAHFGVVSPDARLQRPEFLGGGRTFVNVSPVAQQSATGLTGGSTVLGELAGIGTAVANRHGFSSSFTEHGYIIGLVNARADLTYQQGVERMWKRRTQFDFYWPALAHLGEQAVWSSEIYSVGDSDATDKTVFGYQERWAEYRYKPNRVSGRFRSHAPGTLDIWHFSQNFTARPTLSTSFIEENPPVERVLQVGAGLNEEFLLDCLFDVRYVRAMPMFSIPGMGPRL